MSCADLVELVTGYLEDELPGDDRARFVGHLRTCRGCEVYLDQIRSTIEVTRTLRGAELDPALRDRLLAALRGAGRDWPPPG
ncbi:MAG: anti-sigma factor family protein [Frankia sp.]